MAGTLRSLSLRALLLLAGGFLVLIVLGQRAEAATGDLAGTLTGGSSLDPVSQVHQVTDTLVGKADVASTPAASSGTSAARDAGTASGRAATTAAPAAAQAGKVSKPVTSTVTKVVEPVTKVTEPVAEPAERVAEQVLEPVTATAEPVAGSVANVAGDLVDSVDHVATALPGGTGGLVGGAGEVGSVLPALTDTLGDAVDETVTPLTTSLGATLAPVTGATGAVLPLTPAPGSGPVTFELASMPAGLTGSLAGPLVGTFGAPPGTPAPGMTWGAGQTLGPSTAADDGRPAGDRWPTSWPGSLPAGSLPAGGAAGLLSGLARAAQDGGGDAAILAVLLLVPLWLCLRMRHASSSFSSTVGVPLDRPG